MDDALASLQMGFQDYILGHSPRALALVESTATLSAERRLDIYHNAYRARLTELLADTYERVALYIGDETFSAAALDFIEQNAPTSRSLRNYGAAFPAFLADRYADDPEVAELAEMDKRLRDAFDGVDADPLSVLDVASWQPLEWESAVFILLPTHSFQHFKWNTPAIWQALNEGVAPAPAESLAQAVTWLFWRKGLQPHFRSLAIEEYAVLQAINDGHAFGALCTLLAKTYPELDVTPQIAAWLRIWLDDGILRKDLNSP